jgi:methylenetetrahydrofolate reductase (NADPH)
MRNKSEAKHSLVGLLQHARYEVLPTPSTEEKVLAHIPVDRTITVTASPSKGLDVTFDLAERLGKAGYTAVPHLAARMVSGRAELEEICARLTAAGITTVFVPGGDAETVGTYPDALALLEDLKDLGSPFAHVGITGYPESHPSIHDDLTIQAMWDKRRYATHVVSNLTFDPQTFATWLNRMRARGITLPLLVGMPGPVDRTKLLGMATKIGVGESTRFLAKNKGLFARLAAPGGFTGERFLEQVASTITAPTALVEGLHIFTFNQIAETEAWRTSMIERLGR